MAILYLLTVLVFNIPAHWGPAIALLGLSYLPAGNLTLAVVILTITVGLNGAHYVGFMVRHIYKNERHHTRVIIVRSLYKPISDY